MSNKVLEEILTKIEERSDEIRCFCPDCGKMNPLKYENEEYSDDHWEEWYVCWSCGSVVFIPEITEYNKMRFEA